MENPPHYYDKTTNRISKNRISSRVKSHLILFAAALILAAGDICFGGEAALQQAWTDYLRGDYERAVDACRRVARNKMLGEEGHYIMGFSFLKLGDYKEARKNFEFVLDSYPNSAKRPELLLGIADSYYLQGEFGRAEECYIRLLRDFPDMDYAGMAYLRMGVSQRKLGKWQEAESSFSKVVRDFPLSLETEAAKDYLKQKAGYFSVQVGAFSKGENARRLCGQLKKKGYDAYIEKTYDKDRLIYRVRIGKFATESEAQKEAARLKKEGLPVKIRI